MDNNKYTIMLSRKKRDSSWRISAAIYQRRRYSKFPRCPWDPRRDAYDKRIFDISISENSMGGENNSYFKSLGFDRLTDELKYFHNVSFNYI